MFRITTKQQTNQSSSAGILELILSKNNRETKGRNNESALLKDHSPYLKGRETMG